MPEDLQNFDHYQLMSEVAGESNFDDTSPENSFSGFDEPDNLFGLGKKARRRRELKRNRADLEFERQQAEIELQRNAVQKSLTPDAVAVQNVAANQPLVSEYVQRYGNGQIPQQNPAALALQATQVFQDQVQQKQYYGVPEYNSAHDSVIEDVQNDWGEPADEFFGAIISSVFKAGQALIRGINAKREANGKAPLFAGKNWKSLANKVANNESVVNEALTANERAFLALTARENVKAIGGAGSIYDQTTGAFIGDQQRQALMQYLPYILVGAAVIYFIGKKS